MTIPGNLLTTAMAVMPHTNIDQALKTALSLDIPFWPQLPNYSYCEDMYVQAAEHFPGIVLDMDKKNSHAFMFVDEPGMQFIFSALSGYSDQKAKQDPDELFSMIESPKGVQGSFQEILGKNTN